MGGSMGKSTVKSIITLYAILLVALPGAVLAGPLSPFTGARKSVVKIHVTIQADDFALPWQARRPGRGKGTGFIIRKRRIITNAHIVSNAKFIQIQKDGDPRRYSASVEHIAHDCDLATLRVDDPSFFEGTGSLDLANDLPRLSDTVTVLGYPMGGDRLSLTRGVVSRIDFSRYAHSGVDHHLVLQVDAAINPGNSGGPVLFRGRVVGLAFQGLAWAENIGYVIPVPVVRHFLDDIGDDTYNGYPELGVAFIDMRNTALRRDLRLPGKLSGIAIYYLDPFGSGKGILRERDVLLSVDGHNVKNDGTIDLNGNPVSFTELMERKQWGESVRVEVWRDGREERLEVPLENPVDPFAFRQLYDQRPEYVVLAGLVFSPLSRNYLQTLGRSPSGVNVNQLRYFLMHAKTDGHHVDRDEFVVLTRRLAHPVNTYADTFVNAVVIEVNGVQIRNLEDFKRAAAEPKDGFHVISFAGLDDTLVINASAARDAEAAILESYAVPSAEHIRE